MIVVLTSVGGLLFTSIKKNKIKGVFLGILQGMPLCGFLFILDLPALSQPGPSGNFQPNYSYMTSGALCLGIMIIFSYFLQNLVFRVSNKFVDWVGYGTVILSTCFGSYMVYSHFTFPQWHDRTVLEHTLEKKLVRNSEIGNIIIAPPIYSLQKGLGEYSWRNYDAEFYAKLLVRAVLEHMGYASNMNISIRNSATAESLLQKTAGKTIVIDLRQQ